MHIADQSTPEEIVSAETQPLLISISPQAATRVSGASNGFIRRQRESGGLLFGAVEDGVVHVRAGKSFPERIWRAAKLPQASLNAMLAACRSDPELSRLDWVGWYSLRASGGLTESDLEFHNAHFRRSSDIALIVRPESSATVSLEFYSQSGNAPLTAQTRRSGAVSVPRKTALLEPIEVTIRETATTPALDSQEAATMAMPNGGPVEKPVLRSIAATEMRSPAELPAKLLLAASKHVSALDGPLQEAPPVSAAAASDMLPPTVSEPPSEVAVEAPPAVQMSTAPAESPRQHAPELESVPAVETLPATAPHSRVEVPAEVPLTASKLATPAEPFPQYTDEGGSIAAAQTFEPDDHDPASYQTDAPKRSPRWLPFAIVSATLAGVLIALFELKGAAGSQKIYQEIRRLQSLFPRSGLTLRASSERDGILLTWDRMNPAVRSATGATLQIDDGPHHRSLHLDAKQVGNGSFLYFPATRDVSFLLSVQAGKGISISDGTRAVQAPVSQPVISDNAKAPHAAGTDRVMMDSPNGREPAIPARTNPAPPPLKHVVPPIPPAAPATTRPAPTSSQPSRGADTAGATPVIPRSKRAESPTQHVDSLGKAPHSAATSSRTGRENSTLPNPLLLPLRINSGDRPISASNEPGVSEPQNPSQAGRRVSEDPMYMPPRPLRKALPELTSLVPDMVKSSGEVDVEVKVDTSGRVMAARIVKNEASANAVLCDAVLAAARRWVFQPAKLHGTLIDADCVIAFQFSPSGR